YFRRSASTSGKFTTHSLHLPRSASASGKFTTDSLHFLYSDSTSGKFAAMQIKTRFPTCRSAASAEGETGFYVGIKVPLQADTA
ncbi:hypothetical protein, partial [Paenibacillus pasadenensis]|uniref:hypothetical protein n=1 Tax=Paenibacillus pasadenensis TaxID=217090 RepID=UPI001C3FD304